MFYRWEFLRRNPQYCKDYNEFMGCFGAWLLKRKGRWPHDEDDRANWTKSEKRHFQTKIAPALNRLRRKWHVSDLFPPDFGWEDWQAIKGDEGATFPPDRFSDIRTTRELKRKGFMRTSFSTRHYEHLLLIQVDLNSPMKDLLEHTRKMLRYAQNNYRREMEARGVRLSKSRRRLEDYDLHLKTWDLKKEGKRNTEIARLVFPSLSVQSALYKVRDHLKAADKLIAGHYREIS